MWYIFRLLDEIQRSINFQRRFCLLCYYSRDGATAAEFIVIADPCSAVEWMFESESRCALAHNTR